MAKKAFSVVGKTYRVTLKNKEVFVGRLEAKRVSNGEDEHNQWKLPPPPGPDLRPLRRHGKSVTGEALTIERLERLRELLLCQYAVPPSKGRGRKSDAEIIGLVSSKTAGVMRGIAEASSLDETPASNGFRFNTITGSVVVFFNEIEILEEVKQKTHRD